MIRIIITILMIYNDDADDAVYSKNNNIIDIYKIVATYECWEQKKQ